MKKMAILFTFAVALCARAQIPMPPEAVRVEPGTGYYIGVFMGDIAGNVIYNRSQTAVDQTGFMLFDGAITNTPPGVNKWCTVGYPYGSTAGTPAWTVYQFANGDRWAVTNYVLYTAEDAPDYNHRDPVIWWIEGTNDLPDGLAPGNDGASVAEVNKIQWELVDARTNDVSPRFWGTPPANYTGVSFDCSHNKNAYNAYRLHIFKGTTHVVSLSEWKMSGHSGSLGGDFGVLSGLDAANVGCFSAELPFYLEVNNGGPVELWVDYDTDPEAFGNSFSSGAFTETTNAFTTLAGLMPDTVYYWRHRAVFNGVEVTNKLARAFTTLGAVVFTKAFAHNDGTTLTMECALSHDNAADTTVTLWTGTDPDELVFVDTWENVATPGTRHGAMECALGTLYWFRFTATYQHGGKTYAYDSGLRQFRPLAMEDIKALYWGGGTGDIAPGTPLPTAPGDLTGRWDATTKNWAVDEFGNGYVAWTDAPDRVAVLTSFNQGSIDVSITLAANVALNKLSVPYDRVPPGILFANARYILTAGTGRTITLVGDKPEINIADSAIAGLHNAQYLCLAPHVTLVAENGFEVTGKGRLKVESPSNEVRKKVVIKGMEGSNLWLVEPGSSMNNADEFVIANPHDRYGLNISLTAGPNNRVGDTAAVRMTGFGIVNLVAAATGTESVGPLVLDASGWLKLAGSSTETGVFTFADIQRGRDGNGTLLVNGNNENDADFYTKAAVLGSLPGGVILPWASTTQSRPVMLNPVTRMIEPMTVTNPPTLLSDWHQYAGERCHINGTFTPSGAIPTVALQSLGIHSSTTLDIGAGETLTLSSGQLALSYFSSTLKGGALTSGTNELCILTAENSSNAQILTLESALVGEMDVVKSGRWSVLFQGAATNTYKGTFYAHYGRVRLANTSGMPAVTGDLVVNRGGSVEMEKPWQLSANTRVFLREGGVLRGANGEPKVDFKKPLWIENGAFEFVGSDFALPHYVMSAPGCGLVFANGGRVFHDYYMNNAPMRLSLQTDVLCEAASSNQSFITTAQPLGWHVTRQFSQSLHLSEAGMDAPVVRVFDVRDAVGLKPGVPELVVNMPLATSDNTPVELVKVGDGIMALEQFSGRFRGSVSVTNGTLWLNGPYIAQTVANVSVSGLNVSGLASAKLHAHQPTSLLNTNNWVTTTAGAETATVFPNAGTYSGPVTFFACGSAGRADVFVSGFGTLGGTGGTGGSVFVNEGGTFRPGTFDQPDGVLKIGGDLDFRGGGSWHVDVLATKACNTARVAGDVWLGGNVAPEFFSAKRPKGTWVIATYEGEARGKMSAPPGCSVRVDEPNRQILLHSGEAGTLLLVR